MLEKLPSKLVEWISASLKRRVHNQRITPERVDLYVLSTPEFFNDIVADYLVVRQAQCGFNAPEHSDWVYPALCFQGGAHANPQRIVPLNSWILKSPVDPVPSFRDIVEERDWRRELVGVCSNASIGLLSSDELHEGYVKTACEQVIDHVKLLSMWSEAGHPREQQDCYTGMARKKIKHVLVLQRLNELDAKEKLGVFKKYYAPAFLIERLKAALAREHLISEQLGDSMRFC